MWRKRWVVAALLLAAGGLAALHWWPARGGPTEYRAVQERMTVEEVAAVLGGQPELRQDLPDGGAYLVWPATGGRVTVLFDPDGRAQEKVFDAARPHPLDSFGELLRLAPPPVVGDSSTPLGRRKRTPPPTLNTTRAGPGRQAGPADSAGAARSVTPVARRRRTHQGSRHRRRVLSRLPDSA